MRNTQPRLLQSFVGLQGSGRSGPTLNCERFVGREQIDRSVAIKDFRFEARLCLP